MDDVTREESPCKMKIVTARSYRHVVTSVSGIGAGRAGSVSRQNGYEAIDERDRKKSLRDWQGVRYRRILGPELGQTLPDLRRSTGVWLR